MRLLAKNNYRFLSIVLFGAILNASKGFALEATTEQGPSAPCAVVENFKGELEVLDPSRTHSITMGKSTGIPCGGWVSSQAGWAIIRHRDGHDLRVGPNTFIEIPENSKESPDQVVLYHGEMFGSTEGGGGDLRIVTANGRVKVPRGNVLVNYDPEAQDTQLVALDQPASLENRFDPHQVMKVKAGESTSLNFKQLRVLPTFPKAVSVAALRAKLALFRVNEKDASEAYAIAENRAERRLAATLSSKQPEKDSESSKQEEKAKSDDDLQLKAPIAEEAPLAKTKAGRKLASDSEATSEPASASATSSQASYERSPTTPDEAAMLKTHLVRKMTAGEDLGEQILFPDKFHGKPRRINLVVEDPGAAMNAHQKKTDDVEKKKLIDELSKIHED